ncbi:MAG: hypothetical protein JSS93_06745 [Bacteroidetes bacterium]|nr:hypothetical protein [Bacteroidota bacterium]
MSLTSFFQVATVTFLTFISTNTDNLIIYTGFLTAKPGSKIGLLLSYYASMLLLLAIIFGLSLTLSHIPENDIKYIGLLLSGAGLFLFAKSFYTKSGYEPHQHIASRNAAWILAVAMLMDSFDTISVFVPLFADSNRQSDKVVAGVFIFCFLLLGISGLLISRLKIFRWLAQHSHRVLPVIMVLVGIYIYLNTAGDVQ